MRQNVKALFSMLQKLLAILNSKQKRKCVLVFICVVIGSIFELLGVSCILPFIQAMLAPKELLQNRYIQVVMDIFHISSDYGMLILIGVGIIILYFVKNIYLLFSAYIQSKLSADITRELSTLMLRSYMKRPYLYFVNNNSANILRGINVDVLGVYNIISNIFKILSEVLNCVLIALFLLCSDAFMALGVILIALICLVSITFGFKKRMYITGQTQREAYAACNKFAYQAVNGIKEITVLQRREDFVKQYDEAVERRSHATQVNTFVSACPGKIIEAVCVGGMIGVVCIRIGMGMEMATFVPRLGTFAVAAFKMLPAISNISAYLSSLVFYKTSLEETYNNITSAEKFEDFRKSYALERGIKEYTGDSISFKNVLEIKNVTWQYSGSEKCVLDKVDLTIAKGESVALIGASGAGKSTLVDIILGLLPPQKGTVEMDGIDIYAMPMCWAKIIGYVPQSVYLIDDTIRKNITFGLGSEKISDEKIWEALEKAQLKDFVQSLPKKLDTIVGERGIKFSGGQRQRVAIARALYNNPDILILDEATSALDGETEAAVMEAIEALQGKVTLIIVAHRMTTIEKCDKIYEVINQKIVQREKKDVLGTK